MPTSRVRRRLLDLVTAASALAAAAAAAYFALRHGDLYLVGDTMHHRSRKEVLLVAMLVAWAAVAALVLVVRCGNPDRFWAEWRREREELRQAKAHRVPPTDWLT